MSIIVNTKEPEIVKEFTVDTMELGNLYYIKGYEGSTLYLKSCNGGIIWLEQRRAGINDTVSTGKDVKDVKFVLAPAGTQVTIEN